MTTQTATPKPLTPYSGPSVSRANPMVRRLLEATFPEYHGRTIQLRAWDKPRRLENYWDGGSRSYWRLVRLSDGAIAEPTNDNPFQAVAHVEVDLPDGHVFVEHAYFCGKDMGIRIYGRLTALSAGESLRQLGA